jgi:NAD(P)-dependent dehydrogenase (short-subunit alcohol dehydrogenase family)
MSDYPEEGQTSDTALSYAQFAHVSHLSQAKEAPNQSRKNLFRRIWAIHRLFTVQLGPTGLNVACAVLFVVAGLVMSARLSQHPVPPAQQLGGHVIHQQHPWSLEGRSVLLTGAAGAIGRTAARAFTQAGARVLGVDRNEEPLADLVDTGQVAEGLLGELTDQAFVDEIATNWTEVDVLVNNVGAGTALVLADTTDEVIDAMLDVNLRTAVRLCRLYTPGMAERRQGKVINISSVLALHPLPTVAAYAAAKASLIGFTRAIALEYAPRGVQCNVLAPGYIAGPKNADYFNSDIGQHFVKQFMPTRAAGSADALNGPLLFLASSMSDHVNGHVLVVDGGYSVW